jgi:polar amino acid transport system substrate-binding protein
MATTAGPRIGRTRWRLLAAIVVVLTALPVASAPAETVRIESEAWADYAEADGTGFAWDIVRAVYEPAGVEVAMRTVPYARAVDNVIHGRADAWLASYRHEHPRALYPEWHFDADRVQAVFRRDRVERFDGPGSLRDRRVGWIRGYELGKYLEVPLHAVRLNTRDSALAMLARGRIAYFLDAAFEIDRMFNDLPVGLARESFVRRHVMDLNLYLAFAPTERGRQYLRIWDRRFPKLLQSGRIAEIYDAHDMAVWPFAHRRADATGRDDTS